MAIFLLIPTNLVAMYINMYASIRLIIANTSKVYSAFIPIYFAKKYDIYINGFVREYTPADDVGKPAN